MEIEFNLGNKGKKCYLRSDETQYIISELKKPDKDESKGRWDNVAYLSTPEAAFDRILEMNIRASDAMTLMELRDDIMRIKSELSEVWRSLGFSET